MKKELEHNIKQADLVHLYANKVLICRYNPATYTFIIHYYISLKVLTLYYFLPNFTPCI